MTPGTGPEHFGQARELKDQLEDLTLQLSGDPARQQLNESTAPSISGRAYQVAYGHWETRQMPTQTYRNNLELAEEGFASFENKLGDFLAALEAFESRLDAAGAPYTPGRKF